MLDKDQIAAASQVLVKHWRDGTKLARWSQSCGLRTAPRLTPCRLR
jgi:hypothetical protein